MLTPVPARTAFTLIELLITVAIIAIMAAIAVPNFLEAQTRAKSSRVASDLRTTATALETYAVDANRYPPGVFQDLLPGLFHITTPIAYLSSVQQRDPFKPRVPGTGVLDGEYLYYNYQSPGMYDGTRPNTGSLVVQAVSVWGTPTAAPRRYALVSLGPDRLYDAFVLVPTDLATGSPQSAIARVYDPSNGTVSSGDIGRFGGQGG